MEDVSALLAAHPFLAGMAGEHISRLAQSATEASFDEHESLFRVGEPAQTCFLVIRGQVDLEVFDQRRGPIIIQTIEDGGVVGWSWVVPPYRWSFDARAVAPTQAIALQAAHVREACEKDSDLGYELFKKCATVIADRILAVRMQLVDIYTKQ
ncbi:MAG: cyclic nucleotide-binding domain-containing protein [Candidatus Hydrogenedentes bacterium]|nr:cyclic nucleotide-binding domain-containing protein [Candidatus Hydrogenedentota bacterium]